MLKQMLAAAIVALISLPAAAQDYPNKPVTMIVPFPPGGAGDVSARLVTDQLSTDLNQRILVENKPGANTAIGINAVLQAPGDGYTIGLVSSSMPILDLLQPDFTLDFDTGFKPVTMINRGALVLVVRSDVQANTFADFIDLVKSKPGEIDAAGAGGATDRLAFEMFKSLTGLDITYVPYQGGAAGLTGLLNGEVSFGFFPIVTVSPHLQSGALRPLAVTTPTRSALLPDVPTIAESGYADYDVSFWFGVIAPPSMPDDLAAKVSELINKAVAAPNVSERLIATGTEPLPMSPAQFGELVARERESMGKLARESGMLDK